MKRKRGKAKPNPKKASLARTNEAIPNVVGLNTDYSLEDLLCEHNATMETETPQDEPSKNDHHAALEQEVVDSKRIQDKGNSVRNKNTAYLGNVSKFAASTPARSSKGADTYADYDSRMETETPRAEASMSGRQTNSVKGGGAVNGGMGFFPNALREIVISVISELSKEAGDVTAKVSSGNTSKPISNAPTFLPQDERTIQEVSPSLNPQYKKQELNASLSVIKKIMKLKAAQPFNVPIDPIELGMPDYFEVIDTPMDFGTICYNLENGYKYMNSEDVYKDVQRIWENCSKYNRSGDYILELMKQVRTNFMKYWTAAGLHMEHDLTTNGYALFSAPTESTMMDSTHRKGLPVRHVPDAVGASLVQRHQPSSVRKRAYQPPLGSNEPKSSLGPAGVNASRITEPNRRRSMRRRDHPVVPLSDKTRPSQTQFIQPLAVENQPQLSSNQPQPSQQHTEVNTCNAEPSMRRSMRRRELPVVPLSDKTRPSQTQFYQPSAIDNQPQLSSNQSQRWQQYTEVNTSNAGYSQHSMHLQGLPVGALADSAGPNQVQFHGGSTMNNQPQLSSNQPHIQVDADIAAMPIRGRSRINLPSRGGTRGLSIDRGRHVQDVAYEPIGDELSEDGIDISRSHGHTEDMVDKDISRDDAMPTRGRGRINQPFRGGARQVQDVPYELSGDELSEDGMYISRSHGHNKDMVDEDTPRDDAMPTKGNGRINQPSRGGATGLSIGRGQHMQDLPYEPIGDNLPGDGIDISRSHRHDSDMVDEDTPRDDGGESKGEGRAPLLLENSEQRIPVIVYKGMLVVPPQEDGINFPGVAAGIVNAIQGKFVVGKDGPTWKKVSAGMKEYYFREWNRHYKCDDAFSEREVKKIWNVMAGEQYKRMCYRARQQFWRSGHPSWCGEGEWKRHLSFYANENMKKKCEQARKNRNSDRDGLGKSKHSGGSRSFVYHELMMKKENPEKVITEDEVFLRTHTKKGTDEFIDAKAKKIFEDYTALKDGPGFDSDAWIEASGGIAKNRVYGFGSLATASSILGKTPPSSSHWFLNENLTESQQFNEKVCEKVDKLRAEIHSELKTQLQSEHAEQMEKMKADFELRLQEAIRSVTASQCPPPRST